MSDSAADARDLALVAPQTFLCLLRNQLHGDSVRTVLHNTITDEWVPLPDDGIWSLAIDDDTGYALLQNSNSEDDEWAQDYLEWRVMGNLAGSHCLCNKQDERSGWLQTVTREYSVVPTKVGDSELDGLPPITVNVAVFKYPRDGYIWVDINDLYNRLELKLARTAAIWFAKRIDPWSKLAAAMKLSAVAVCRSSEYKFHNAKASTDPESRVLPFPSVHVGLLLVIAFRAAYSEKKQNGAVLNELARDKFLRLTCSLLRHIPADCRVPVRVDPDAWQVDFNPMGVRPTCIPIAGGVVSLGDVRVLVDGLVLRPIAKAEMDAVMALDGSPFHTLYIEISRIALKQCSPLVSSLQRQLVWFTSRQLDQRLSSNQPVLSSRCLKRVFSNTSNAGRGKPTTLAPILNKSNGYSTTKELSRYLRAAIDEMEPAQFISLSGPDGTKITPQLSIVLAAVMNQETKKCAIGPPQVNTPLLIFRLGPWCGRFFLLENPFRDFTYVKSWNGFVCVLLC